MRPSCSPKNSKKQTAVRDGARAVLKKSSDLAYTRPVVSPFAQPEDRCLRFTNGFNVCLGSKARVRVAREYTKWTWMRSQQDKAAKAQQATAANETVS